MSEAIDIGWLRQEVHRLEVAGQWHAIYRANLRDELILQQNRLVERILREDGRKKDPLGAWSVRHADAMNRTVSMIAGMKKQAEMDYATVSVAVRALARLADDD